jgi:hypothetical protein
LSGALLPFALPADLDHLIARVLVVLQGFCTNPTSLVYKKCRPLHCRVKSRWWYSVLLSKWDDKETRREGTFVRRKGAEGGDRSRSVKGSLRRKSAVFSTQCSVK